ncbi:collectin-12-like [Haliotis rubra]|uniref:collectin-12-like n=1 Tax=Haliotis rubra TaxID=36100 RepID=UPI001EE51F1E|nr:collectin-12-like [Haliotis rubra]
MLTFSLLFTGYMLDTLGPFLSGDTLKSECAVACVNNANCSSFFYDVNTQECYLEKYVYVASHQLQNRSGVQYYSLLNRACPASNIYCRFTNQCLRLHSSAKMKFTAARTLCMENSGHLAFIRSEEENRQAVIVAKDEAVWIGLERNDTDSEWRWTNGQFPGPYVNWNQANLGGALLYGRMFRTGKWGTFGLNGKVLALCEIDLEENDDALRS